MEIDYTLIDFPFNGKSLSGLPKICFFPFSSQSLWKGFCSTVIFNFFQIISFSLSCSLAMTSIL